MNLLNGSDNESLMTPVAIGAGPIRQLVRARDVAKNWGSAFPGWFNTHPASVGPTFRISRWDLAEAP
jgi:hypothetical protein